MTISNNYSTIERTMGGVPTKHHSKSKVGRRRSQLSIKHKNIVPCPTCGGATFPHSVCPQCGGYAKKGVQKTQTTTTTGTVKPVKQTAVVEEKTKETS